ncbi:hypothetical protein F5X96DRAFT_369887 [Biscogniauxia mediterranea]|nr:hypothetical protein F5X96DRAFT_369887 [Biscogniauxia mediterranea]
MIESLWKVETGTFTLENAEMGFQGKHCRKAMRLAVENGHMGCRDLICATLWTAQHGRRQTTRVLSYLHRLVSSRGSSSERPSACIRVDLGFA